jgi:hypothetical protein
MAVTIQPWRWRPHFSETLASASHSPWRFNPKEHYQHNTVWHMQHTVWYTWHGFVSFNFQWNLLFSFQNLHTCILQICCRRCLGLKCEGLSVLTASHCICCWLKNFTHSMLSVFNFIFGQVFKMFKHAIFWVFASFMSEIINYVRKCLMCCYLVWWVVTYCSSRHFINKPCTK